MVRDSRRESDQAVRITTASTSRNVDIAARQRRYLLSMSLRTICFVGAIVVGDGWLRWVLVAGALVLPYIAVVMANASATRSDGFGLVAGVSSTRELTPGAVVPPQPRTDG